MSNVGLPPQWLIYITVEDLYAWQLMAVPITVRDAESGEDVTARVLDAPDQLH